MKYADKLGARFSMVLGDDELAGGIGRLKNMENGKQSDIPLDTESFTREFTAAKLDRDYKAAAGK
jgi:histidyl-tRNA synthetase